MNFVLVFIFSLCIARVHSTIHFPSEDSKNTGDMAMPHFPNPLERILNVLVDQGGSCKAKVKEVRFLYKRFVSDMNSINKLKGYQDAINSMSLYTELLCHNVALAEHNAIKSNKFAPIFRQLLEVTLWNWFHLDIQPDDSHLMKDFINQSMCTISRISNHSDSISGLIMNSNFVMKALINCWSLHDGDEQLDRDMIIEWQRKIVEATCKGLAQVQRAWLHANEKASNIRNCKTSIDGPFTTNLWSLRHLGIAMSMSWDELKVLVVMLNKSSFNEKCFIRYQIPRSVSSTFRAHLNDNDLVIPPTLISMISTHKQQYNIIQVLDHLNRASQYLAQMSSKYISPNMINAKGSAELLHELHEMAQYGLYKSDRIYFRLLNGAIMSSLFSEFDRVRVLIISNALYHYPDRKDRDSGTTLLYYVISNII